MFFAHYTKEFDKALKKLYRSGRFTKKLDTKLEKAITLLCSDTQLPPEYKDHQFKGPFSHFREFHIKDDLLVIYQKKEGICILLFINIGSHAFVFE